MVIPITSLKNFDDTSKRWYIVADINVLLENIRFLSSYIVGDPMCSIMTPVTVVDLIERKSEENAFGRYMITKRYIEQLSRICRHVRFAEASVDQEEDPSPMAMNSVEGANQEIIECCLRLMSNDYHVVLVTKYLQESAEKSGIHVYNISYVMRGSIQSNERLWNERRDGRPKQPHDNDRFRPPRGGNLRVNGHGAIYRGYRNRPNYQKGRNAFKNYKK